MDFITFLITNADKIGAAAGMIIVIIILRSLVNDIGKRQAAQSERDDAVQIKILDLYTRITDSINRQVAISEAHETAAKERAIEQEKRDTERMTLHQQQIKVLQDMVAYLPVMSETKARVDTIHATQVHLEGSMANMGTDIIRVVTQSAADNLENYKKALSDGLSLVENALKKMQPRIDEIDKLQESHVEAEGQRHVEVLTEIRSLTSAMNTVNLVMNNTYHLLEQMQQLSPENTQPITLSPRSTSVEALLDDTPIVSDVPQIETTNNQP